MAAVSTRASAVAAGVVPVIKSHVKRRVAGVAVLKNLARGFNLDRHFDFWSGEINKAWSLTELRARVVDVVEETHDVKTFILAPNGLWKGHRAGQFVTIGVEVEGVRETRCYSVSSAPGSRNIAITVKRVPGGRVSTWMHDYVRRGDVVRLGAAAGDFALTLPTPARPSGARASWLTRPRKLLLLSGGSGVTPVMAILRDLAAKNAIGDIVFLHAARSRRDVIFGRELETLAHRHPGLRVVLVLDEEQSAGGRLDTAQLRSMVPDLEERETFLCGPAGMMDALSKTWTDAGIADRLKTERFGVAKALVAEGTRTPTRVKLTLARSGRTVETDGVGTLLEQLERAGEQPVFGCRMGICNTCSCKKRTGVVEDAVTGAVSGEPDEDIRLCVSRARADIELDI